MLTNVKNVHEIISHATNSLKETLDNILDGHAFDSKDLIFKISSDLVCSILFGDKLDTGIEKRHQLLHLYEQMSSLRGQQILVKLVPTLKYLPLKRAECKKLDSTREKINRIFEDIVEESKSVHINDEVSVLSACLNMDKDGKAVKGKVLCVSACVMLRFGISSTKGTLLDRYDTVIY